MCSKLIEELREKAFELMDIAEEDMNSEYFERAEAYREAIEIVKKHENKDWISVKERLPDCEVEVQITARRKYKDKYFYIVTNAYYEDGTMLEEDSSWNWIESDFENFDEEADCYLIDEGWWEYRHYNPDEVYNNVVEDEVIAWKPLTQPYKGE